MLSHYWWPGNIRELENLVERLVAVSDAEWITDENLPVEFHVVELDRTKSDTSLLDRALGEPRRHAIGAAVQQRLLAAARRDIEELLPQLEPRAVELAALAVDKLRKRGEHEARDLRETLERQRARVREHLETSEREFQQLTLGFDDEARRQLEANMRAWPVRLAQFDRDLAQEPGRIREFYEVRAQRIEPVALVYLWPETN